MGKSINDIYNENLKNEDNLSSIGSIKVTKRNVSVLKNATRMVLVKNNIDEPSIFEKRRALVADGILTETGIIKVIYDFKNFQEWMIPSVSVNLLFFTKENSKIKLVIGNNATQHYFWKKISDFYRLTFEFKNASGNLGGFATTTYYTLELIILNQRWMPNNQQSKGEQIG